MAESRKVQISDLSLADYKNLSSKFEEDVKDVFNFEQSVENRNAIGGTSKKMIERQVEILQKSLAALELLQYQPMHVAFADPATNPGAAVAPVVAPTEVVSQEEPQPVIEDEVSVPADSLTFPGRIPADPIDEFVTPTTTPPP